VPALSGLKVLDLSRLLPGPYLTLVLADLGADVVKVEDPNGGDYLRWMPPILKSQGAMFHALIRNKRSIALNLKKPGGAEVLLSLVRSGYDVVVESFRPGVMERLGVGYEALRAASARAVLCSISGYGQDGPMRDRAGHDLNYVGIAGALGSNGPRGGPPVPFGVQVADVGGGSLFGAVGILAALYQRERTGEGAWLDVSMTEGALGFMTMQLGAALAGGQSLLPGEAPLNGGYPCYGVYETRDGKHMTLGALEPHFWKRFCDAVERPDLVTSQIAQGEEGDRVRAEVAEIFGGRTQAEWVAFFEMQDACCEPVRQGIEVASDPQLTARGMFFEVDDPVEGPIPEVRTPVRFVGGDEAPRRPAPGLGADTDAVLEAAGIDETARANLKDDGVLG